MEAAINVMLYNKKAPFGASTCSLNEFSIYSDYNYFIIEVSAIVQDRVR